MKVNVLSFYYVSRESYYNKLVLIRKYIVEKKF